MAYAIFFKSEAAARDAAQEWAKKIRADWHVSEVEEVRRRPDLVKEFGPWRCRAKVAPCDRAHVPDVPARMLRVEARGPFAQWGEDDRGTASAVFEAVWPADC